MIDIKSLIEEEIKVIRIVGEVDASSSIELDTELQKAIGGGDKKIIVDCSNLNYISSAGLGVFMSYIQDINANGITMVICGLNEKVQNVFEILGLTQLMQIETSLEQAKKFVNGV